MAYDNFAKLRDGEGLETCCNDSESDEFRSVIKIMNHYEILSIGINNNILSEQIYSDYYTPTH